MGKGTSDGDGIEQETGEVVSNKVRWELWEDGAIDLDKVLGSETRT